MKRLDLHMGPPMTHVDRARMRLESGLDALTDKAQIAVLAREVSKRLRKLSEHRRAVELERFQKLLKQHLEE